MADHASPEEPTLTNAEPVSVAEVARLVVAALVTVGVFNFDDATLNTITLVVGGLLSIGLTVWARMKVTPVAAPKTSDGQPLATPVPPPPTPPTAPPGPTTPPPNPPL